MYRSIGKIDDSQRNTCMAKLYIEKVQRHVCALRAYMEMA